MKLRILRAAIVDLERGADFYEAQREGLGIYFNDCLMSDIESLRLYAGIHQKHHGLYRCMSKRFPYAIYYDKSLEAIEVYAILDCRQAPSKITRRLNLPQDNKKLR